jgi:hypothetical protein
MSTGSDIWECRSVETRAEQLDDLFQLPTVGIVEGGGLVGVEVEDSHQITRGIEDRYDNLGARARVARYMTWELMDVGDHLSATLARGGAADASVEGNLYTADRALVGSYAEQLMIDYAVKARPTRVGQTLVQNGDGTRHGGHGVIEVTHQSRNATPRLLVQLFLFHCQIVNA